MATPQEIRDAFALKIDSFDKWKSTSLQLWGRETRTPRFLLGMSFDDVLQVDLNSSDLTYVGSPNEAVTAANYWWHREQVRIYMGVYAPRTEIMSSVVRAFRLGAYCVYPSSDPATPEAVCYTPDPTMGLADRQLKLSSLGKLLRKLCPLVTDAHIQKIEAIHRSELDPTLFIARTKEEIQHVYQNMVNDSACMRYDSHRWSLPDHIHPSHVYSAPGLGVAYFKRGGEIVARAVVYEASDTDKRYLRLYGDSTALRARLERNGYREGSLAGAKILAIRNPAYGDSVYVVPYIDGVGGRQSDYNGTHGYVPKHDPDHIQLVSVQTATSLQAAGYRLPVFKQHSEMSDRVPTIDEAEFQFHDELTDEDVNLLTSGGPVSFFWKDGQIRRTAVHHHVLSDSHGYTRQLYRYNGSGEHLVYYKPDDELPPPQFDGLYFDDFPTRMRHNYVALSEEVYPNLTTVERWIKRDDAINIDGQWRREADCVKLYRDPDQSVEWAMLTTTTSAQLRKAGWVSVLPVEGIKTMCWHTHPRLRLLVSGKHAIQGTHDITELWDGRWASSRSVTTTLRFGVRFNHLKSEALAADVIPTDDQILSVLTSRSMRGMTSTEYREYTQRWLGDLREGYGDGALTALQNLFSSRFTRLLNTSSGNGIPAYTPRLVEGVLTVSTYACPTTIDGLPALIAAVRERDADLNDTFGEARAQHLRSWVRVAQKVVDMRAECVTYLQSLTAQGVSHE